MLLFLMDVNFGCEHQSRTITSNMFHILKKCSSKLFAFSEKNKIVSFPFLRQIVNFRSFIPKKQAHFLCVLEKKGLYVTDLC